MSTDQPSRPRYTASHWGAFRFVRGPDGRERLETHEGDPDPSPIGHHMLDPESEAMRVRRPAVRAGVLERGFVASREGRGDEPMVEVDWTTALDLAAAEIGRVRREYGNDAIFGGSYGWSSAGRFHHAQSQVHRFLNVLGGYVRSVDTYSMGAARVLMKYLVAPMDELVSQHSSWDVLAGHTQLFIAFGGLPLKNTQIAAGGSSHHMVRTGLEAMAKAGVRFVNFSPTSDDIPDWLNAEWIPVRPGTDTAVLLAMAHVLHGEGLADEVFLERYTVGYERILPYLLGESDGVAKTPEWAEEISGVPAARIRSLAREASGSRTMINSAWSLQRAIHGEQPYWAIVTLASMLGQIGLPGGGFGLGYGATNTVGSRHANISSGSFPQEHNPVKAFIPVARITEMLEHPGETFPYDGGVHVYPDIRLIYWAGGNPFHHHQDLNRMRAAWKRPDCVIVNEQYWNAQARHADIVFPATTTWERMDIGYGRRDGFIVPMSPLRAPIGEARNDFDIFLDLSRRLGVADAFDGGLDAEGWLRLLYDRTANSMIGHGIPMPDFDSFMAGPPIALDSLSRPVVMLEAFRNDPQGAPLGTPSGRIELYSERIASFGLADCPGYAAWLPPIEWLGSPKARIYPLHLLSDQPRYKLHSQLDCSPYSRAGKVREREPLYLNPADAAARGLADGDIARVFNTRGSCLAGVVVTQAILPGVVRLSTGSWFDPGSDGTERHGNPNSLTIDIGTSSLGQGCSAQSCLVQVEAFRDEPPPVEAFIPPFPN